MPWKKKKAYDIAKATSATRGGGNAFVDAKDHLPLLGAAYQNRKMLYYDYQQTISGTAGVLGVRYFSANGLYDPDVTGTGHQPIGFDQAMLFFEQYVVYKSTITITVVSNSSGTHTRCGVFLNPDTSNPTIGQIMENGYMKSQVVIGTASSTAGPGQHLMKTISLTCDSVAYFDSKGRKQHMMRDNFSGTVAANPSEQVYFGVFAFNMTSATTYEIFYDVEISYDATFWEPRKIAVSTMKASLQMALSDEAKKREESKSGDVSTELVHIPNVPSTTPEVISPLKGVIPGWKIVRDVPHLK